MKQLCSKCPGRDICQILCPEARMWVDEVEVAERERPIGIPWETTKRMPDTINPGVRLRKSEADVASLLLQGYTKEEIVDKMGITVGAFYQRTYEIRKKLKGISL